MYEVCFQLGNGKVFCVPIPVLPFPVDPNPPDPPPWWKDLSVLATVTELSASLSDPKRAGLVQGVAREAFDQIAEELGPGVDITAIPQPQVPIP